MRIRPLVWLCVALVLGAGGYALHAWLQPPPAEAPAPPTAVTAPARAAPLPLPPALEAAAASRPRERREQLEALARAPGGLAQLEGLYARSTDGVEREQVLGAAARVGDAEAVTWLAEVALRDERLAPHAAQALGSVADRRAAPALVKLLREPGPVHLRANAARALGTSGSAADAPLLVARVADAREPLRVRQEAALALAQVGRAREVGRLTLLLDRLGTRGDPPSSQLRLALVQALGGIGGPAARQALLRHARRPLVATEQAFVRQALAQR